MTIFTSPVDFVPASFHAVLCHITRTLQFMGQLPNDFLTLPAVEQIALLPDWVQFLIGTEVMSHAFRQLPVALFICDSQLWFSGIVA